MMRHYTVRDGLPSNTIYNIFQDSKGFIWFCTDLGISRFDGHHFENFTSKDGLPDNEVFKMKEDAWGRCWLWLYNNMPCYLLNDKIYTPENDALCRQLDSAGVLYCHMFLNKDGDFCLGGKSVYTVRKEGVHPYVPVRFPERKYFHYFLHEGQEYMLQNKDVYRLEEGKVKPVYNYSNMVYIPFYSDGHLYTLQNKRVGYQFFCDLRLSDRRLRTMDQGFRIYDFAVRGADQLWWCTEKGLMTYRPSLGRVDSSEVLLPGISVNHVLKDKENNYWYTTINNGVYMKPVAAPAIYNRHTGLADNNVLVFGTDGEHILAGYDNGTIDILGSDGIKNIRTSAAPCQNRIRYIYPLGKKELLIGTDKRLELLLHAGRYRKNLLQLSAGPEAAKAAVVKGRQCVVGFASKALCYDLITDSLVNWWFRPTTALAIDEQNTCWLGTLDGLYYKPEGKRFICKYDQDSLLFHSRITMLSLLGNDGLVIATDQHGLFIRKKDGKLVRLTEQDGLSSNICRRAVADKYGAIWLCTNNGLDKISAIPGTPRYAIYHFSQSDGIISNNINDVTFKDHKVYVATSEGIVVLDEHQFAPVRPPKAYILSVYTRDSIMNYPEQVSLNYHQNNLRVTFTGISFADGKDISYKYLLQGGSTDTVFTTSNSIELSTVKPGAYQLMIWAAGKNKRWSKAPAVLRMVIHPPFWQKKWFMACIALLLAGIVYLIYRQRVKAISRVEKEKAALSKSITALELHALRAQINPHFMFNALNAIQNYYSRNDERSANYYLTSFARLIRQSLNHAKTHWLTVAEELAMLRTYIELEQMRFDKSFRYELVIDPALDPNRVYLPTMLLQPYVENAINHGLGNLEQEAGLLVVSCELSGASLRCRIDDNGVGFEGGRRFGKPAADHKSMGMAITQQRVETINQLYNTTITTNIISKQFPRHGTVIEIIIPLNITW